MKKLFICLLTIFSTLVACESSEENDTQSFASYRYALWRGLLDNQVEFNFVGTQLDTYRYPPYQGRRFDNQHEGIGAIDTDGVLANLDNVLSNIELPDLVLIGIGINDILKGDMPESIANNVEAIILKLREYNPDITIIIEQIPGLGPFYNTELFETRIEDYNNLLLGIGSELTSFNSQVRMVDMYSDFSQDYFVDDLHYNILGANYIANKYYEALTDQLDLSSEINILPIGDSRVVGYRNLSQLLP